MALKVKADNSVSKLLMLIQKSDLPDEYKQLWHKFIAISSIEVILIILDLIRKDEQYLKILSRNIADKTEAFSNEDSDKLKAILDEEKALLSA